MKKKCFILITLIALAPLLFSDYIQATTYTEKTFLAPRPVGVNIAMEYTTWHDRVYKKSGRIIPRNLQATGFYQASVNDDCLGKYFGIKGKNSFQIGPQGSASADVDGSYLIHNQALVRAETHSLAGKVTFDPRQEIWGVRFDLFQENFPVRNIFLKANMPVVNVTNNMHMSICNSIAVATGVGGTDSFTLNDFFRGCVRQTNPASGNLQSPLTRAKINGKHSTTGVADLDLALGCKLLNNKSHHLFVNIGTTIPTGRKPSGRNLFEPIMGNGGHYGVGGGLDAGINLWENDHNLVRFLIGANYRFLLENSERRTLGLKECNFPFKDVNGDNLPVPRPVKLLQYYLVALDQQVNKPLMPAANILTQKLNVTPGSQLDTLAAFSWKHRSFIFDLGYNLFWKDTESVSLLNCSSGSFGIARNDYDTDTIFNEAAVHDPTQAPVDNKLITQADLNSNTATTPSQLTHKIFAGIGCACDTTRKYPLLLGIGGSYEFASDNAALETYALWLKAGISF